VIDYRNHIEALIDPEHSDALPGGGRLQDISVIITNRHGGVRPVAVALLACQARELAFSLLELSEAADRQRTETSR